MKRHAPRCRPATGLTSILVLLLAPLATAATYTWNGSDDNSWDNPLNWTPDPGDPPGVPGATDTAVILSGKVHAAGAHSVAELTFGGGRMAVDQLEVIQLEMTGGLLDPGSLLSVTGQLTPSTCSGGTIDGQFMIASKARVSFDSGTTVLGASGSIDSQGNVTMDGGGIRGDGGTVTNRNGALWQLLDGTSTFIAGGGSPSSFTNHGKLVVDHPGTSSLDNWEFEFGGVIDIRDGTLECLVPAAFLDGLRVTGSGPFHIHGADLQGAVNLSNPGCQLLGGQLDCRKFSTIDGTLDWRMGTITGSVEILPTGTLDISGSSTHPLSGATIENHGTINWIGTGAIEARGTCHINNDSAATIRLVADGTPLTENAGTGSIENHGLIEKASPGTTRLSDWDIDHRGHLECNSGTLAILSPITLSGCYLEGTHTIDLEGDVTLDGGARFNTDTRLVSGSLTGISGEIFGTFDWLGGTLLGAVAVNDSAELRLGPPTATRSFGTDATLDNHGLISWTSGDVTHVADATFDLHFGSMMNVTSRCELASPEKPPTLRILAGATLSIPSGGHFICHWRLNNQGDIHSSGGTFDLHDNGLHQGDLRNDGGTIAFHGGTQTMEAGCSATGTDPLTLAGATMDATVPISLCLDIRDGTLQTSGAGSVTLSDQSSWTGASLTGSIVIPETALLVISGNDTKSIQDATLDVSGTMRWEAPLYPIYHYGDCVLTVQASGMLDFAMDHGLFQGLMSHPSTIHNHGTIRKSAGIEGTELKAWVTNNHGTIAADSGILSFREDVHMKPGSRTVGPGRIAIGGADSNPSIEGEVRLENTAFGSGTLTGIGGVIHGALDWNNSTLAGNLTIADDGVLTADSTAGPSRQLAADATLEIRGNFNWNTSDNLDILENAVLGISGGGRLSIDGRLAPGPTAVTHEALVVEPAGTIAVAPGSEFECLWPVDHRGHLDVDHGFLYLNNGGSLAGSLHLDGGYCTLDGGSFQLHDGFACSGDMIPTLSSGELLAADVVALPVTIDGGRAGSTGGGELQLLDGSQWNGGTLSGVVRVPSGSTLDIDGGGHATDQLHLHNEGSLYYHAGTITGDGASLIENHGASNTSFFGNATLAGGGDDRWVFLPSSILGIDAAAEVACHWRLGFEGEAFIDSDLTLHADSQIRGSVRLNGVTLDDARVILADGTHRMFSTTDISGLGKVEVDGAILRPREDAAIASALEIASGEAGAEPPATLTARASCYWDGGTINGRLLAADSLSVRELPSSTPKAIGADSTLIIDHEAGFSDGTEPITGNPGARIEINGAYVECNRTTAMFGDPAGTLVATGAHMVGGGPMFGTWDLEADNTRFYGPLDFTSPSTLHNCKLTDYGETIRLLDSQVRLSGNTTVRDGTLELAGAEVTGQSATIEVEGTSSLLWTAGAVGGDVWIEGGASATASLAGPDDKTLLAGALFRNELPLTLGGTGYLHGEGNAVIENAPGGTLTLTGDCIPAGWDIGNRIFNRGTMKIGASPGFSQVYWDLELDPAGTLEIEIEGPVPMPPEFDRLMVFGTATLAGTLEAVKIPPYEPDPGDTFNFLMAFAVVGEFDTIVADSMRVDYTPTTATLRVVAGLSYEDWCADHGLSGPDAEPGANPDGDALDNWNEYAFNTDPNVRNASPLTHSVEDLSMAPWFILRYRTWQDRIDAGVVYTPSHTRNFSIWSTTLPLDEPDPDAPMIPGSEARRCGIPMSGFPTGFLKVTAAPPR
jgi:hypothetical protein